MIPCQGWFWTVVSDEEKKELYEGQPSNGGKQLATQLLIFWPIIYELCLQHVGLQEYEGLSKGEYSKLQLFAFAIKQVLVEQIVHTFALSLLKFFHFLFEICPKEDIISSSSEVVQDKEKTGEYC